MKEKILVADDMRMDREILTELLEDEFDVTAVADGEAAVRELEANNGAFACVLLDIVMPKLDGFGVLRHIRERKYGTPVIALTSMTDSDGHIRCYEAGVRELLEKPYDRKILLYKVRRMIEEGKKVKSEGCGDTEPVPVSSAAEEKLKSVEFKLTLLNSFQEDFSNALVALRKAIAEHNEPALHDASHSLNGIESNLKVLLAN